MPESVSFPIRIFLSESVCFHSRLKEPRNAPALPPFHASPPIRVRLFTATLSRLPPRLSPRLTAHLTHKLPLQTHTLQTHTLPQAHYLGPYRSLTARQHQPLSISLSRETNTQLICAGPFRSPRSSSPE